MKKRFVQGLGKFALPIPNLFPIFRNIWNHQPRNLTWTTTVRLTFFFPKKKSPECPRTEDSDDLWYWGSLSSGTSCRCFETCFFPTPDPPDVHPDFPDLKFRMFFCILKAPFLLIDFGCFSLVEMVKEIVHFFKNQSCWAVRFALAFNIQKSTSALFFWSCREWYNFLWAWLTIIGPPRICKTLDN